MVALQTTMVQISVWVGTPLTWERTHLTAWATEVLEMRRGGDLSYTQDENLSVLDSN